MLVPHLAINKEFFAEKPPTKKEWLEWVKAEIIDGKVIDGKIWINRNHFAANTIFEVKSNQTAVDLLIASA